MRAAMRPLPLLALAAALTASPALAEGPKVVASIKPVHSLVAAVMEGVAEPALIVRGAASPHTYAMKPSDAKALAAADLVFWIGPELEGFLDKPVTANAKKATSVTLLEAPGVTLLDAREGGAWEAHDHGHEHKHDHDHKHAHEDEHGHDEVNTHIWLSPANARAMVAAIAEALSAKDPANAAAYTANAERTARSIDALDAELKAALAPVAGKPFVVFHDAYQYFEAQYGLNGVGAITVNPERRPSAKRLSEIRAKIGGLGAACVFAEPQFEPALVNTIVEGTPAKKGVLDPEGADLKDGPGLYPALMRNIAASLKECLGS
ncbi:zinc ABC transporter substrate-binding protein ZnuA [Azospirillum brasilense]|uniref:High-affinity zinc uptake system protein ZnuA n=1 Tax=Azospirillum brasilense TaxID=192 RepID=A0A0P0E930_AZOBR|nr:MULTISPECIES: zinc ABC transporter substrate-binding protein ZnuA [Azospirillum]ALJ34032.1 zinc transporter [Azospirillum brasilense]MDW7553002.1 zinc ABC transporter substrate-binding protein ZnuA [Azospirillum brasilense]MDW7591806.1 zinc ABC transporter substrate-binding protein ZnuA [Azospirillum brasilense]MDW7627917.1 zinc ABC transporter substrate-binding protein ZnuA [Azospirillum brasilense]MDX5952614.1 zinc ABC transporter substrate-binding protein ZnuA [Azospirillum brasilense]